MFRGGRSNRNFRGRGRGRGNSSSNNQATRLKGLFADGIWHCNCTPRLPAEHFKVKKEGKNQGRWFYTCQQSEPNRCDFFLWDEAAKQREEAAVLSGNRSEPGVVVAKHVQLGWNAGGRGGVNGRPAQAAVHARREDSRTASPSPPPPYSTQGNAQNGIKRDAQTAGFDAADEDLFPWPLTGQEEVEMAQAADTAAPPQTPHKAQKTGVYSTPATTGARKLPWLETAETGSNAGKSEGYFGTPSKTPAASTTAPVTPGVAAEPTTAQSPSRPTRYKDALADPADSGSSLTSEVLSALQPAQIPPDIISAVRGVVSKHDLKTQGIAKGRDVSRLAIKAKDAKIAELQARIASLEAEREVDRGVVRQMKWEKERGLAG